MEKYYVILEQKVVFIVVFVPERELVSDMTLNMVVPKNILTSLK